MPDIGGHYTDPYESQIQSQYGGRQQSSLTSKLFDFAKNVLVFGAVTSGIKFGWSKVIGPMLSKGVTLLPPFKLFGRTLQDVVKDKGAIQNAVLGKLFSGYNTQSSAYESWASYWGKQKQLLKTHSLGPFTRQHQLNMELGYNLTKFKDFWQAPNLSERVTGKVVEAAKGYAGETFSWYLADKAMHIHQSGSEREYKEPDFMGLRSFTKFSAQTIPGIFAWRMLGPVTGMLSEVARDTVVQAGKYAGIGRIGVPALQKISSFLPKIGAVGSAANRFYNGLDAGGLVNLIGGSKSAWAYAKSQFTNTYKNYIKSYAKQSTSSELEKYLANMKMIEENGVLTAASKKKATLDWAREIQYRHAPAAMYRAMDLRYPAMSRQAMNKVVSQYYKDDNNRKFWTNLLGNLQNKGVSLYDRGVYKLGSELLDFRAIRSDKVFERTLGFIDRHVQIGGIPLVRLFPYADRKLSDKPVSRYLKPDERYLLGHWNGATNSENVLVGSGVYIVPKTGGLYVGKHFWTTRKDGTTGGLELRPVVPRRAKFQLYAMGEYSTERQIMENYAEGSSFLYHDNIKKMAKERGPLGKFFIDTLDLQNVDNPGGVFGYFKGIFNKFISKSSPLNIEDTLQAALKGDIPSRSSYYQALGHVLRRGHTYFSGTLKKNPKVLEALGVDVTMSPDHLRKLVQDRVTEITNDMKSRGEATIRSRIMNHYQVDTLLDKIHNSNVMDNMNKFVRRVGQSESVQTHDQMFQFLAADNVARRSYNVERMKYVSQLAEGLRDGLILKETEASAMKIWAQRFDVENIVGSAMAKTGRKDFTLSQDLISEVSALVSPYKRDYNTVIKNLYTGDDSWFNFNRLFTPFYKANEEEALERSAALSFNLQSNKRPYSGYVALPYGDTNAKFLHPGESFMPQEVVATNTDMFLSLLGRRVNRLFDFFGGGLDVTKYKTGSNLLFNGLLMKRVVPAVAMFAGFNVLDNVTDANPMFDGTILSQGIRGAGADIAVRGRMLIAGMNDVLGIDNASKYAEGLMPGFINSPLMRFTRGVALPLLAGARIGMAAAGTAGAVRGMLVGAGLGVTQGFGAFDITKSYDELKDIYSGREEVPVRRGRWWIMSAGNFSGGRIHYFRPMWYPRLKGQYKSTPDAMGGPIEQIIHKPLPMLDFNPLGWLTEPNHYAFNHYYSQPFPSTGVPFDEFPFIGPAVASTIGRLIQPPHLMHQQEILNSGGLGTNGGFTSNVSTITQDALSSPFKPGTIEVNYKHPVHSSYVTQAFDEQLYRFTEGAGIVGFGLETLNQKLFDFSQPFQGQKQMQDADQMTSFRRAYWDANLGDPIGACFVKDTKVLTRNGRVRIQDIIPGDSVVSIDGKLHNVVDILHKKAHDLYKIKIKALDVELIGTSKHHIPIFKQLYCKKKYDGYVTCIPGFKGRCKSCQKERQINLIDTNLCDIKSGDYVTIPINDLRNDELIIDLSLFVNDRAITSDWIYGKPISQKQAKYYEDIVDRKICSVNDIDDYTIKRNVNNNIVSGIRRFCRYIKVNKNISSLIGWYLSEGNLQFNDIGEPNGCVEFSLSKNEAKYAVDIIEKFKVEFGSNGSFKYENKNNIRVWVQCLPFSILVFNMCGHGAHNKYISHELKTMKTECLLELFKCFLLGDGCYLKRIKVVQCGLASEDLIRDIFDVSLSLGFFSHLNTNVKHGKNNEYIKSTIVWTKASSIKLHNLFWNDNEMEIEEQRLDTFVYDRKLFVKVKSVDLIDIGVQDVYDLHIDDLNYYIANHIVVHNTELFRRFVPRPRQHLNIFNPLLNTQPSWMPERFRVGFAYGQIPEGELLLPGAGYESTHDVTMDYPVSADMLGLDIPSTARVMLGMYPKSGYKYGHSTNDLDRLNRNALAAATVYDPYHNVSGLADNVIRSGRSFGVQKIKELSDNEVNEFIGPTDSDVSEMNWLLKMRGAEYGTINYQFHGQPVMVQPVRYSERKWERDMEVIAKARTLAAGMQEKGIGWSGESYSHMDRLNILGNVAPYSNEYKMEEQIVRAQIKSGAPLQDELHKVQRKKKAIMMKEEFFPYRFKGKVLTPDSEYNNMSLNEDAKAAAEYSLPERMIGSAWEHFSHLSTPIHCFDPLTYIETEFGMKFIKDVLPGDNVYNNTGKLCEVKSVWSHEIGNDVMSSIKLASTNITIQVTQNHMMLAAKMKYCSNGRRRRPRVGSKCQKGACVPGSRKCKKCGNVYQPEYTQLCNLSEYDYLCYKIPDIFSDDIEFDLWDIVDHSLFVLESDYILPLQNFNGCMRTKKNSNKVYRYVNKNPDLYRLLGYYASEGDCSLSRGKVSSIIFTFNKNEIDYINDVVSLIKKYCHNNPHISYQSNVVHIKFTSAVWAYIFSKLLGRTSSEKHIDPILHTNIVNSMEFIKGVFRGDGTKAGHSKYDSLGCNSLNLSVFTRNVLLNVGIPSSIRYYIRDGKYMYVTTVGVCKDFSNFVDSTKYYEYTFNFINNDRKFIYSGYLYSRIDKIITVDCNTIVYDLEMCNDESYNILHSTVHNSKFLHVRTPLESYERESIYGRDIKMWGDPITHYADAYRRGFMSKTTPFSGGIAGMIAGYMTGGPGLPTAAAGIAGAVYGCYDEKTEALTKNGWKKWYEIDKLDSVLSYDVNSCDLKWKNVNDIFVYDYDGEMYHFNSRSYDLLVSPEHRIFYYKEHSFYNKKRLVPVCGKIGEIYDDLEGNIICPQAGNWGVGNDLDVEFTIYNPNYRIIKPNIYDFLIFVGFYIAEGWKEKYKVFICQKEGNKFYWILDIIKKLGFSFDVRKRININEIVIYSKDLSEWLDQFGKGANNKKIPNNIRNLKHEYLYALLEGFQVGDGSSRNFGGIGYNRRFTSSSEELIDNIQEILIKLGYGVSKPKKSILANSYTMDTMIRKNGHKKWYSTLNKDHIQKVKYIGKIWDVNIGGGYFIVRRNGKIAISGNSIHGVYREITDTTYIPHQIKEARKINRYFDQVSYAKNTLLYQATGDEAYLEEARSTMAGLIPGDLSRAGWSHMYRATPPQERPYLMGFMGESDPDERQRILNAVPEDVGELLKNKWYRADDIRYTANISRGITQPIPTPNWVGWAPEVDLSDVKLKVIEKHGQDAHDFGLGYNDQMNRINNTPWLNNITTDMSNTTKEHRLSFDQGAIELRRSIEIAISQLGAYGDVTVMPSPSRNNMIRIVST